MRSSAIPRLPTSSYLWRNVIPELTGLGRLIVPDLIGMGDSEKLPNPGAGTYRFVTYREYLWGFISSVIGPDQPLLFVGHDWRAISRELQLRQAAVDLANTSYGTVAKELKDAEIKSDPVSEGA